MGVAGPGANGAGASYPCRVNPIAVPISADATHLLRQQVLRPHQSLAEMEYPGDRDPTSAHFGCFVDDELVSIGSVYREAREGGDGEWRLRGMATAPQQRSRGLGGAVLASCLAHATANGRVVVWCNARTGARSLYERAGFEADGDEFEPPEIGPHVVMVLRENRH